MNLVFFGTPKFAATILATLVGAGHHLLAVYTQPPRPARRGHRLQASPVQLLAEHHRLTVRCPARLRDPGAEADFARLGADAAVVAAYGLILPPAMLAAPRLGCLNVHASLLPRWRGAAPVERALLAGDRQTGITIMQMEAGLDTGPILSQRTLPIGSQTGAAALTEALAELGSELILATLAALVAGRFAPQPQPSTGATYAPKIRADELRLDWRHPADALERQVRALDAWFEHRCERIRVHAAALACRIGDTTPGTVLDDRLTVACGPGAGGPGAGGSGALRLTRLQRPGRTPLDAADLLRGYPIPPGTLLPCPAIS
ncbi:MAG: methionyl-tRNA formyltransferase [Stellaceae bacterium]